MNYSLGTLIDGQPIITLPPKTVTLKKVDFSMQERAFYSTLEAESREQFKVGFHLSLSSELGLKNFYAVPVMVA